MPTNGMGPDTGAIPPRNAGKEITGGGEISDGDDFVPGFSLARVAPRTPSTQTKAAPLLDGRPVPEAFRQAYRELRFSLEQARERSGVRTVGVVSLEDGDGRSLTAVNLALALTEGGMRRVALLDSCFANPQLAGLLAAEAETGLADVLAQKVPAERAMFAAGPEGLFAMSAGNVAASPVDAIDSAERFGMLANRLATVFDYVLVDTPPLLECVDGAALSARLDGVVVVVRARKTKATQLDRVIAKLGESRVLGLVLNQI